MTEKPNPDPAHIETGKLGESLAAQYLEDKGWKIAARNWRAGKGEIDIIAWENDRLLVFVEVKTRSSERFGGPEGAVKRQKMKTLARTAGFYMEKINYDWEIRFDTIAIVLRNGNLTDLRHAEDVFFPRK
ncbi:MAG: YraN family protein [Saprospiraceae bacterium]